MMTKQQAIEYLEKVLENWNTWRVHHEHLCNAIETLLEEVNNEKISVQNEHPHKGN